MANTNTLLPNTAHYLPGTPFACLSFKIMFLRAYLRHRVFNLLGECVDGLAGCLEVAEVGVHFVSILQHFFQEQRVLAHALHRLDEKVTQLQVLATFVGRGSSEKLGEFRHLEQNRDKR